MPYLKPITSRSGNIDAIQANMSNRLDILCEPKPERRPIQSEIGTAT